MPVVSRFAEPQHPVFRQLNASIGFDWRLGPYDVEQSRAHATMLADGRDHLRRPTATRCSAGSSASRRSSTAARSAFREDDEDIHMAIERRLTEIVGPVGGKLHTARSRNDQVATDMAMFTRAHALQTLEKLQHLQSALVQLAERHEDWAMPGYTHLQRAQPVYLSHHLLAYFWMFRRDARRFEFVLGSTERAAARRGRARRRELRHRPRARRARARLRGVVPNSIDAVSNRDFVLDFLAAAATCATHLSRLGAEIVLWSSRGVRLRRGVATRGRRARRSCRRRRTPTRPSCCAARRRASSRGLAALHGVLHGLPLTYNKDMQEDKEQLFDAVDTLDLCLQAAAGMLEGIAFDRERLAAAAADELIAATDIADLLVRRGVPFRQSHGIVAGHRARGARRRAPAVRAHARGARARTPRRSTTSSTRCSPSGRGWSRRSPRAGRRSRACASSSAHARAELEASPRSDLPRDLLRPPGGRGRAGPRRLHARARRDAPA